MSPVDPRELKRATRTYVDVIETDRLCVQCRYNLRGLPTNGKCPECGRPIHGARSGAGFRRFSDNLAQAPLFYLKTLAVGAWLTAISGVVLLVSLHMTREMKRMDSAIIASLAAVVWWVGVFIVTGPRAFGDYTLRDEALDGPILRVANRVVNAAWLGAGVSWVVVFRAPLASRLEEYAEIAAGGCTLVGICGLVTLGLQMAALCDWAGDSKLSERFRGTAWILGASVLLSVVALAGSKVPGLLSGFLWWLALAVSIVSGVAVLIFAWSLIQLAGIASWAISNNLTARDTERRALTARERREQEMADRTATAVALQDAAPPPTLGADNRHQTSFEGHVIERDRAGADPYDVVEEPAPPAKGPHLQS